MKLNSEHSPWTIIIIGSKWGTLSFQVSRVAMIGSLAICVFCIVLAACAVFSMVDALGKKNPEDPSKQLIDMKSELDSVRQENAGLKEKLRSFDNQFIAGSPKNDSSLSRPYEVTLDQLTMRYHPEESSYRFQFVLRASGSKVPKANGYIFVILRSALSGRESALSYPVAELKGKRPVDFKQGDRFSITSHKTIRGVIKKVPDPGIYSSVDVLVYSDGGMLLWEKTHDLKERQFNSNAPE